MVYQCGRQGWSIGYWFVLIMKMAYLDRRLLFSDLTSGWMRRRLGRLRLAPGDMMTGDTARCTLR